MNNKLIKRKQISCWIFFILLTAASHEAYAQNNTVQKPPVTTKWKIYKKQVRSDRTKVMVELKSIIPDLVYDLRYASTNNFMNRLMYPGNTTFTFLRMPVAQSLSSVQEELKKLGLGLKIFDAYRPYSATVKFWELVKDERYVANPAKGSGHNRGIAVDLTIIDLQNGKELDMGTGFDNFTDTAHHTFASLKEEVLQNRILLKSTMEKFGFVALESEWWHYFLANGNRFELLDIDFKKLKRSF